MKLLLKILFILITIVLGLVFLYSGYTKLSPVIETFEFSFVDVGIGNWYTAPVMARLMIGLEFFVGLLLILNYNLRKFTLPLEAIIKNMLMLGLAVPVYLRHEGWKIQFNRLLLSFFGITAVMIPFVLNPVDYTYTSNNLDETVNYPLELNVLFQP